MAHDPQHLENMSPHLKSLANWLATALGFGTLAGFVNIVVGILSASWLAYQLYVAIVYELPIKRARLDAIRKGMRDLRDTDRGTL